MIAHSNIKEKYIQIKERIVETAVKSGRNPDEIRLVVVTKTHPAEIIQHIIEAGAQDLGENYLEEAVPKIQTLAKNPGINWHMIGHIQSRKAQPVCENFQYVHSLDSLKLAERISRFSSDMGKRMPVWLEINVGGEDSKSGWVVSSEDSWKNLLPDIEKVFELQGLQPLGLMTIPPYTDNAESSRPFFKKLREIQRFIVERFHKSNFNQLSMGMSSDFEVAIQEGSTCVRIGQAILGPRVG